MTKKSVASKFRSQTFRKTLAMLGIQKDKKKLYKCSLLAPKFLSLPQKILKRSETL